MQAVIIVCIYSVWVIQPWYSDDWGRQWLEFSIPRAGNAFSRTIASWYVSTVSPFSFFQPWALVNAIFATALAWKVVNIRQLLARALATLILILGFPHFWARRHKPKYFRGVFSGSVLDGPLDVGLFSNSKSRRNKALAVAYSFRSKFHGRNME